MPDGPVLQPNPQMTQGQDAPRDQDAFLLSAIDMHEQTAYGSDTNTQLGQERARSIDDYLGKPYGNETEGRSQVISRDVYDTVEWIKPSLLRIFCAGDEVARFDPTGPEDVDAAQQESDYINYVLQQKNNWFNICYEWFTDALLTKNAYALSFWDNSKSFESEPYYGLTDDQLALLMQDQEIEVRQHSARPGPPMVHIDPQTGQPMPVPVMLHDVVIRRSREYKGTKIVVLPPERCMVSESTSGMSVRHTDFFEYWELKSLSDLRAMGYNVPDDLADDVMLMDGQEELARDQYNERLSMRDSGINDPSMRKVVFKMVWIRFDYDGDGYAEMRYIHKVGNTILWNEEVSHVMVASIVPTPLPHRHPGLSVRDMVTDLQEIKTALLRGTLDNTYLANNGRYGISDKVNMEDMLQSRPGGAVRVVGVPRDEIFPFTHPTIAGEVMQVMGYIDGVREERTGTNKALNAVDPNVLTKGISGVAVAQLYSAAGQRIEMIARVFAEGVKELFQNVHELCLKHDHETHVYQLRNEWVTVNPSEWKRRSDMRLSVGLGTGNKEQLMTNLGAILKTQLELLPLGLTEPSKIGNTVAEFTKAAGFSSSDKFWNEVPKGPPPPQVNPEEAKAKVELALKQVEHQHEEKMQQLEFDHDMEITRAKLTEDMAKTVANLNPEMVANMQSLFANFFNGWQTVAQAVNSVLQAATQMQDMGNNLAQMQQMEDVIVRDKSGRAIGKQRMPAGTIQQMMSGGMRQ